MHKVDILNIRVRQIVIAQAKVIPFLRKRTACGVEDREKRVLSGHVHRRFICLYLIN